MKIACVCLVKNAEPRIAEWIAYQLATGFNTVILLDNNSTDRTREIASCFQQKYDVRILKWDCSKGSFQQRAYEYALWRFKNEFAWCAFIDDDEFLVLPPGKSLKTLLDLPWIVVGVAMPWAVFGSNDHIVRPNNLVIKSYLKRADSSFHGNRHIKSIVRPRKVKIAGTPHSFEFYSGMFFSMFYVSRMVSGVYVDMNHRVIKDPKPILNINPDFSYGKLNHYYTRSKQDWEEKVAKNNPVYKPGELEGFFEGWDRNEVFDDSAWINLSKLENILQEINFSLTQPEPHSASLFEDFSLWWFANRPSRFYKMIDGLKVS